MVPSQDSNRVIEKHIDGLDNEILGEYSPATWEQNSHLWVPLYMLK